MGEVDRTCLQCGKLDLNSRPLDISPSRSMACMTPTRPAALSIDKVDHAVAVFTRSPDPVAAQNASGMLGYMASDPDCCSAIARCDGVVEAVAAHLGSGVAPTSRDMQHNAALLLGQLSRASVAFRRKFASNAKAMDALLSLLRLEDTDTVCNVLWALRHLVSEGLQRDTVIRTTATTLLKPLMESDDERVVTSAEALQDVLRRPVPIQTDKNAASDEDEQAAAGLASILNTPPPTSSQTSPDSATEVAEANGAEPASSSSRRKHRLVEPVEEPELRRSKRSRRSRRHGDEEEEEAKEEEAVQVQGEEGEAAEAEGESAEAALAFLIQAAEG